MNSSLSFIRDSSAIAGARNSSLPPAGNSAACSNFSIVPLHSKPSDTDTLTGQQFQGFSTRFGLFIITHGSGHIETRFSRHEIRRGHVIWVNPGSSLSITAQEIKGLKLSFSTDFFRDTDVTSVPLLLKLLYHDSPEPFLDSIADDALDDMLSVTAGMQKECATPRERSKGILQGLFFLFMNYLSCASKPTEQAAFCDRPLEYARHFITLVKAHYSTHKQVADYARMMCLTPGFLNHIIKKKTGMTASHHIYHTIVQEAKKKAAFTTASMKEIAYELGFLDIYHFSKFFKKNAGANFSSFRKNIVLGAPVCPEPALP